MCQCGWTRKLEGMQDDWNHPALFEEHAVEQADADNHMGYTIKSSVETIILMDGS